MGLCWGWGFFFEEYINYLETYTALILKQEIPVHNLYLIDKRQKFSIYTLPN